MIVVVVVVGRGRNGCWTLSLSWPWPWPWSWLGSYIHTKGNEDSVELMILPEKSHCSAVTLRENRGWLVDHAGVAGPVGRTRSACPRAAYAARQRTLRADAHAESGSWPNC